MISAEDVLSTTFRTTRFRGGYDIEAVDDYLDQVTRTLAVHEGRAPYSGDLVTADAVAGQTFEVGKLRESYDTAAVDALLAKIVDTLRDYEKRAAARTTGTTPAVPSAATGAFAQVDPPTDAGLTPAAAARAQDVGSSVASAPSGASTASAPSGGSVPLGAALGLRVLTSQLQIATVRTHGSDTLTVRTPDGATLHVVAVDAGPDGVVLRTAG